MDNRTMRIPIVVVMALFVISPANVLAQFRLDDWSKPIEQTAGGVHNSQSSCGRVISETEVDDAGNGWKKTWNCQGALTSQNNYRQWLADGSFMIKPLLLLPQLALHTEEMNGINTVTGQFELGRPVGKWHFEASFPSHPNVSATLDLSNDGSWAVPSFGQMNPGTCPNNFALEGGRLANGLKEGPWFNFDCKGLNYWGWQGLYEHGKKEGIWRFYDPYFLRTSWSRLRWSETFLDDAANGPFMIHFADPEIKSIVLTITGELKDGRVPFTSWPVADGVTDIPEYAGLPFDPRYGKMWGTWRFYGPNGAIYGESTLNNGTGHLKVYGPDGALFSEGDVINGLAEGTWTYYSYDGLLKQVDYKDGVPGQATSDPHPFKPNITNP